MCSHCLVDDVIYFNVLLNVHISIFILVINQLDAKNLFYNKYISCLNMFRLPCAHRQEVKNYIIQPLVSSRFVGGRPVHRLRGDCAPDGHLQV